jgi:hypothetical protein
MRAPSAIGLGVLLLLGACNANPLLKTVASDYAPIRLGSAWNYKSPDGTVSVSRQVSAAGTYNGRDAFTLQQQINAFPATLDHLSIERGEISWWDSTLGWTLWRRVPYINGNKWELATGNPNITQYQFVDGTEKIEVPAGVFENCFKLRTKTLTYSGGVTATTQAYAWAAPGVGDVRYASEDVNGNITVDLELVGYSIP